VATITSCLRVVVIQESCSRRCCLTQTCPKVVSRPHSTVMLMMHENSMLSQNCSWWVDQLLHDVTGSCCCCQCQYCCCCCTADCAIMQSHTAHRCCAECVKSHFFHSQSYQYATTHHSVHRYRCELRCCRCCYCYCCCSALLLSRCTSYAICSHCC
jgi:hypothetical protein